MHAKLERPIAIIVNPVAGTGRGRRVVRRFHEEVLAAGHPCALVVTTGPDDLPRVVAQHAVNDTLVVLAGGDGTIRSALPSLLGRPNPVLIIPLGTENLLAKHLGIRPTFKAVWDVFATGQPRAFDLGSVNGHPFLSIVGVGFDAQVVVHLARGRRGNISHLHYVGPLWRTLCEYRFPAVRVVADGQKVCDEPALVFVGNLPRYAAGLRILRQARADDGRLDLCIFRCRDQGRLLEHAFWTFLNRHVEHPLVSYHQIMHATIEADEPLPLESDGDPAGHLPAEIKVLPAALNLLVSGESGG